MSEAKDKDRILTDIEKYKPIREIPGGMKYLYEFECAGFVNVRRDAQGDPIAVRLTSKGSEFLKSGGYAKAKREGRRKTISKKAWAAIWFVIGSATTAIVQIIVDKLLR